MQAAVEKNGDSALQIYGVRPREGDVFAAIALQTADGVRIVDDGPPKEHKHHKHGKHGGEKLRREPMTAEGVVRRVLHGPKGETRGVILRDGRIIRFPPHEAPRLKPLVKGGAPVAVRGEGVVTPIGTVIEAHEMGSSTAELRAVRAKPKKAHEHQHGKPHGRGKPHADERRP